MIQRLNEEIRLREKAVRRCIRYETYRLVIP
jgi:hypothetical protein